MSAWTQHILDPHKGAGIPAPAVTTPSAKADLALAPCEGTPPEYLQQDHARPDLLMDAAGVELGTQPQAIQLVPTIWHDGSDLQGSLSGRQASGVSTAAPSRGAAEVFQP